MFQNTFDSKKQFFFVLFSVGCDLEVTQVMIVLTLWLSKSEVVLLSNASKYSKLMRQEKVGSFEWLSRKVPFRMIDPLNDVLCRFQQYFSPIAATTRIINVFLRFHQH